MVLPLSSYRSIPYASVLDYRHTMTEPLWLLSPTKPLLGIIMDESSIIIQAILGGTFATTGLRLLPARERCPSRYLANSEEIISKHQSGFGSLH